MAAPFKFLSISEFEALTPEEKRAYIGEATAELERTKAAHPARGWNSLFRQDHQQAQQPQPKDDKKPRE